MKIALAQIQPEKGDVRANISSHLEWVAKAANSSADLIVFPELSLTGYEPTLAHELAMTITDPLLDAFQVLSDQKNITILFGLPLKSKELPYIGMAIYQPQIPVTTYYKQLLHSDELPFFSSGESQTILQWNDHTIAPAICYESLQFGHAEEANALGASIYLASVAKSENGLENAYKHYPEIAKKYQMTVLMVNSVGPCDNFISTGQSAIWNHHGELCGQMDHQQKGLLIHEVT